MKIKKFFANAALLLLVIGNASASVVYENGTHDGIYSGNNPFTYMVVTQQFTLAQDSKVNSLTYNAFTTSSTVPVTNAYLSISQDGTTIFSDSLGVTKNGRTGTFWHYDLTDYTIELPELSLTAGTYLLGLQVSPTQWDQHWSMVNNGPMDSTAYSYYFRLESADAPSDVPEPSSIAILLLGAAGAGVIRRRKM